MKKIPASAFLGFVIGALVGVGGCYEIIQNREAHDLYGNSLSNVTDYILIDDALKTNKTDTARLVLRSKIEADFFKAMTLHERYDFKDLELMRCGITRRVRVLKANEEIYPAIPTFGGEDSYPRDDIDHYLKANCPGDPKKANWAQQG